MKEYSSESSEMVRRDSLSVLCWRLLMAFSVEEGGWKDDRRTVG
jgi:hypothetical protein